MKLCRGCGTEKQRSEFNKNCKAKDGLQNFCKPCRSERRVRVKRPVRIFFGPQVQKRCRDCDSVKWINEFYHHRGMSDGLMSYCIPCAQKRGRDARTKRRLEDPERLSQQQKKWRVKKVYGLSWDEYLDLERRAGGLCEICGQPTETLCIDHCHATGVVRGLLCSACNTGIGQMRDEPSRLRAAADYLERAAA